MIAIPFIAYLEKARAAFRASPKKAAALAAPAIIVAVSLLRVLTGGGGGPEVARGSVPGPQPARLFVWSEPDPHPIEVPRPDISLQQWSRKANLPLRRNPFVIPLDCYPTQQNGALQTISPPASYWDVAKKSPSLRADQQEQRQILIDNVRIAAESLKLESTMQGTQPGAMINGRLLREGDELEGFRIVKIEPRQVIVESEGIRLALLMD